MPVFGNDPDAVRLVEAGDENLCSLDELLRRRTGRGYVWHMRRGSRSEWHMPAPPEALVDFAQRCARRHGIVLPLRHVYLVSVPPGRGGQAWHADSDTDQFFTLLLQVRADERSGCTQFEGERPPLVTGDWCLFDGLAVHRGTRNRGAFERIFLYATFHRPSVSDANHFL